MKSALNFAVGNAGDVPTGSACWGDTNTYRYGTGKDERNAGEGRARAGGLMVRKRLSMRRKGSWRTLPRWAVPEVLWRMDAEAETAGSGAHQQIDECGN